MLVGHVVGSLWDGCRVHGGDDDEGRVDSGAEETLHRVDTRDGVHVAQGGVHHVRCV